MIRTFSSVLLPALVLLAGVGCSSSRAVRFRLAAPSVEVVAEIVDRQKSDPADFLSTTEDGRTRLELAFGSGRFALTSGTAVAN